MCTALFKLFGKIDIVFKRVAVTARIEDIAGVALGNLWQLALL